MIHQKKKKKFSIYRERELIMASKTVYPSLPSFLYQIPKLKARVECSYRKKKKKKSCRRLNKNLDGRRLA